MCNYMKGSLSVSVFIKRIEHILTYQRLIDGKLYPECFANHKKGSYNTYCHSAKTRNLELSITNDDYNSITENPCHICGKINNELNENGIDRIDSSVGYILENTKSCCAECNYMKIDYGFDDMLTKCILIYNLHKNTDHKIEVVIRTNRFTMRSSIKNDEISS